MFLNPTEYIILILACVSYGWFARGLCERVIKYLKSKYYIVQANNHTQKKTWADPLFSPGFFYGLIVHKVQANYY